MRRNGFEPKRFIFLRVASAPTLHERRGMPSCLLSATFRVFGQWMTHSHFSPRAEDGCLAVGDGDGHLALGVFDLPVAVLEGLRLSAKV